MSERGEAGRNISYLAAHRAAAGGSATRLGRRDSAAAALIVLVAARRGVTVAQLLDRNRGRAHVAFTRQLAMYLTHVSLGRTLTEVGTLFGRDRTTVSYACGHIEDRRDTGDTAFDDEISRLELAIDHLGIDAVPTTREARHARR